MKKLFDGVYVIGDKLVTKNLAKGKRVYNEKLLQEEDTEYRSWIPYRSKLAAAILNGLKNLPIEEHSKVLYLGAASGTTSSHISDIARSGEVVCVEMSPTSFRGLVRVCDSRVNMIPILGDARYPEKYASLVESVDVIYQDIAQPEQAEIAIKNARYFLKVGGFAILIIKARSIDSTKEPKKIFETEVGKLRKGGFEILEVIPLKPYKKDHVLVLGKRK